MPNSTPTDNEYLSQVGPVVAQTITGEFAHLPTTGQQAVYRQSLLTLLNIHQKAKKQRINLLSFIRRVVREQVLVWLAAHGTPPQQATSMTQIMAQNQEGVARFLRQKRFRTSNVVDEVLNDSFEVFFKNLNLHKPIKALISTSVMSIARNKALGQLRKERTNPTERWDWLETIYVTIEDHEIGSLDLPIDELDDEETIITFQLPVDDNTVPPSMFRIKLGQLRRAVTECFAKLPPNRQKLIRTRYQFWTQKDLESFTEVEIQKLFDNLSMDDIAQLSDYTNAHTASVRLSESRKILRDCLTTNLTYLAE